MKTPNFKILTVLAGIALFAACNKTTNPNPEPKTIYDTVTVTKNDTIQLPVDTPNVTDGLVLYLPFTNGSYADSSGLGNVVSAVNGGGLGYDMHGYAQSAFDETGNGGVLTVANNGAYAVDSVFSVSFDFMIRSNPYYNGGGNYSGLQCLLSIVNFSNGNGPTFNVGFVDPSSPQSFVFDVNAGTSTCDGDGGNNPDNVYDTTSFTPQLGAWYNAICVFSKGLCSVYINGRLVSQKQNSTTSTIFCSDAVFVVGGWWNGTEPVNGGIDEVRMYNKALNAQQIAWLSRNFQIHSNAQKPGLQHGGKPGLN